MKLHLINFLCYNDKIFDFGKEGLTLISGPSGSGKTSILRAIFFVLFNEGTKLQTYGKTSCRVELEFNDLKIVRTKGPNRLIVNDIFEDAAGQEIINKKFGDTFKTTGYIQQNNNKSFIMMKPDEKIEFLEKFAFRDANIASLKAKTKIHITKRNDELVSCVSKLEMAKNVLEEMEKPSKVSFPVKCKKDDREQIIKNTNIKHTNCIKRIEKNNKDIKSLEKELTDIQVLNASIYSKEELLKTIQIKINDITNNISNIDVISDNELEIQQQQLQNLLKYKKLYNLQEQYEIDFNKLELMRNNDKKELEEKLIEFEEKLWNEESKEDAIENIKEMKECKIKLEDVESLKRELKRVNVDNISHQSDLDNIKTYQVELDKLKDTYNKLKISQHIYSCPSCSSKLQLQDDKLILSNTDISEDFKKLSLHDLEEEILEKTNLVENIQERIRVNEGKLERCNDINTEINNILDIYEEGINILEIEDDIEYFNNYIRENKETEKRILNIKSKLETESFSNAYVSFKKSLEDTKKEIDTYKNELDEKLLDIDEETLRETITYYKLNKTKLNDLNNSLSELENEKETYNTEINKEKSVVLKKYNIINDEDIINNQINELSLQIKEQEELKTKYENILEKISLWEKYNETNNNYLEWVKKVKDFTVNEKEARNNYAAATMLKDKILEAESIAMLNIIESINSHARLYLDSFFVENPINVILQPFKEVKDCKKPKINICIDYKGMDTDINMLSGGEQSRVVLAYTLALAEMFNTPILMLDECTASLDQDLTNSVFECIKDNFNGKSTLMIAHQVVMGTFDKIIKLD